METCVEGNPYAYRLPLMVSQVERIFGKASDDLSEYARQSQISQAEAVKYFIEHFRTKKWQKTGILWWNIIDGWPQISDAVIDWYHTKKLAYHFIKRAQDPFLLAFDEARDGELTLYAVNDDEQALSFSFEVRNLTEDVVLLTGSATAPSHSSISVGKIKAEDGYRFLLITSESRHGEKRSHFITQSRDLSYARYLSDLQRAGMDEFEGF
jgi:beta-mannosidase